MRTANRNIDFLRKTVEQVNNDPETTQKAVDGMGTPKEIDAYFDVFTIAFGKHLVRLMNESPRTLEHSVEEILADFRLEISMAKDEFQVDYVEKETGCCDKDTHAPGSCPL